MGGQALRAVQKSAGAKKSVPKQERQKRASLFQAFSFSSTKDIRLNPVFRGSLSKWTWRFYTHRLTRAGRWFSGLSFTLGFLGLISLNTQGYIPFLYVSGLWLVTIVCTLFNRPRVTLRSRHASRIAQGEALPVEVEVTQNSARWAFDLNLLPARLPLEVDAMPPDGTPIGALAPHETRRVRVNLLCRRRGVYRLFGFRIESDFPFGIVNAYRVIKQESTIIVHPAFIPLQQVEIPTGERFHAGGIAVASHRGDSFEYLGNRDFRQGDSLRDIDWRATARQANGMPIVREWREEFVLRVGLVLDTFAPAAPFVPRRSGANAARTSDFEQAVSLCAALGEYLARQDYLVDIFAAGPTLHHLVQGRGSAYVDQILDILASVETTSREPLTVLAPLVDETLGQLTTVICVFLGWDDVRRDFVENLRASGVGVKVILVGDVSPAPMDRSVIVLGSDALAGPIAVL